MTLYMHIVSGGTIDFGVDSERHLSRFGNPKPIADYGSSKEYPSGGLWPSFNVSKFQGFIINQSKTPGTDKLTLCDLIWDKVALVQLANNTTTVPHAGSTQEACRLCHQISRSVRKWHVSRANIQSWIVHYNVTPGTSGLIARKIADIDDDLAKLYTERQRHVQRGFCSRQRIVSPNRSTTTSLHGAQRPSLSIRRRKIENLGYGVDKISEDPAPKSAFETQKTLRLPSGPSKTLAYAEQAGQPDSKVPLRLSTSAASQRLLRATLSSFCSDPLRGLTMVRSELITCERVAIRHITKIYQSLQQVFDKCIVFSNLLALLTVSESLRCKPQTWKKLAVIYRSTWRCRQGTVLGVMRPRSCQNIPDVKTIAVALVDLKDSTLGNIIFKRLCSANASRTPHQARRASGHALPAYLALPPPPAKQQPCPSTSKVHRESTRQYSSPISMSPAAAECTGGYIKRKSRVMTRLVMSSPLMEFFISSRGKKLALSYSVFCIIVGNVMGGAFRNADNDLDWRLVLDSAGFCSLVLFVQVYFCPESLHWLVRKHRIDEAIEAFRRHRASGLQAARDIWYHRAFGACLRTATSPLSRIRPALRMEEPPVPVGMTRVRWRCSCGSHLYDDFQEIRPGAAKALEERLNNHTHHGSSYNTNKAERQRPSTPEEHDEMSSENRQDITTSISTSNNPTLCHAQCPQPLRSSNVIDIGPEGRWLLVCSQSRRKPTNLTQLDVCSARSDRELFTELKQAYTALKSRMARLFSLRAVKSIRFVQFELHIKDFVDIRKVPDVPPETKKDEYTYQPCDLIPPVGEHLMTHLFHHPEDANDQRAITFLRTPKKRQQKLTVCPQQGTSIGWGIHLVEGWALKRVWLLALLFFLSGTLVFAVCWSVLQKDLQGAFGVSAYVVALIGLILGTIHAHVN